MTYSKFPVDLARVGPAVDMGIEEVRRRYGLDFRPLTQNYSVWCDRARVEALGTLADLYYNKGG